MAKAQGQGDKRPWPLGHSLILRVLGSQGGFWAASGLLRLHFRDEDG